MSNMIKNVSFLT